MAVGVRAGGVVDRWCGGEWAWRLMAALRWAAGRWGES